jgi:TolA-binding protein
VDCEVIEKEGVAERYLRGELSEADREAFEEHYFTCASCFDELETHRALRQALLESTDRAGLGPSPLRKRRALRWAWAAAAALAAGVAGLAWWWVTTGDGKPANPELSAQEKPASSQPVAPPSPPAPVSPPETSRPHPAPIPSLATLARVDPPPYTPTVLRGVQDEARRRFRDAMRLYASGDYAAAEPGLAAAAELDPEAPDSAFFLGICRLMSGDFAAAVADLERTIALGESPYLEEAHFYLAKARLKQGDVAAAGAALESTVRLRGEHEREARSLLVSLRRVSESFERRPP